MLRLILLVLSLASSFSASNSTDVTGSWDPLGLSSNTDVAGHSDPLG